MFFTAALWMILLAKIGALFTVLAVLGCIASATAGIFWAVNAYMAEDRGEDEPTDNVKWRERAKKICITWMVLGIFGIVMAVMVPDTKEMLVLATFKGVDQYNATHPSSMISVNGVVGTADDIMKIFDSSLQKVEGLVKSWQPTPPTEKK